MSDPLALALVAAGGVGAAGGAWLAWGATYQRDLGWRLAWCLAGAVLGGLVALGLPASCVDHTTGQAEPTERSGSRYP